MEDAGERAYHNKIFGFLLSLYMVLSLAQSLTGKLSYSMVSRDTRMDLGFSEGYVYCLVISVCTHLMQWLLCLRRSSISPCLAQLIDLDTKPGQKTSRIFTIVDSPYLLWVAGAHFRETAHKVGVHRLLS